MISGSLTDITNQQVYYMGYSDSAIFNYSPQQVFDVVADIEKYPEFLPGWITAQIVQRSGNNLQVEQELGIAFLKWRFTSEAVFERPYHIHITSLEEPFFHMVIDWTFFPVDENSTRVSLVIKSDSAPGPEHQFLRELLSSSTKSLLDHFRERVAQVTTGVHG